MATAFSTGVPVQGTEERFFFKLACSIALVFVAGFAFQLGAGRSSFAVPIAYHLHAFVFFGWVALFVTQSALVAGGNVAMHRKLGWLSAVWVPAMVIMGLVITVTSLRRTGGPFFFDANEFLLGNIVGIAVFALMVFAAVRMRKQSDWHRRLMVSAIAAISGPGWGRLLPAPLFMPYAWEITNAIGLVFIAAGMIRDKRVNGSVHPAWWVGAAATVGWVAIGELIAYTPWAIEFTRAVMEGYPGAARPMQAYLP